MINNKYPSKKFMVPTRIKFIDDNMLLLPLIAIILSIYVLFKKTENKSSSVSVFFLIKIFLGKHQ